jgi:glycosyl transferase family 25
MSASPPWPIFVINLARNTERLARVSGELSAAGLAFTRFEAVNGWELDDAEVVRVYDADANRRKARHPMVRPEMGCYLSHYTLWQQIAAGGAEGAVILEDDFHAAPHLAAVLESLQHDPGDWDMVKLFSGRTAPRLVSARELLPGVQLAVPFKVPSTTLGYVIRRDAARRLVETSLPFARPIDEDHKFYWEFGLKIAAVLPPPLRFGVQEAATGTITAARQKSGRAGARGALRQAWRSLRYRIGYLIALHRHRRQGTPSTPRKRG